MYNKQKQGCIIHDVHLQDETERSTKVTDLAQDQNHSIAWHKSTESWAAGGVVASSYNLTK